MIRKAFHFTAAAVLGSTLLMALILALTVLPAEAREPKPHVFTGLVTNTAVGGYDPVAYFTDSKPVPGSKDITLEHDGVTWRFASEANRALFKAEPAKYAPQFGGYCAWAVSQGYTAKGDPTAWSIVDSKLYLNYDKSVRKTWLKNAQSFIKQGEANWPSALEKSS